MILTSSTGGGHDARADALAAWARDLYGEKIDIRILRPLESKESTWGRFGVWLYNTIQRRIPILHMIYFYIVELIGDAQGNKFIGREVYQAALEEFKPQLVVSLHDFLGQKYFQLAQQMLGEGVRCATYCGEFSDGDGFSKHWVAGAADRWIGRTESSLREAFKRGVSPDKLDRFTFFLPPEDLEPIRTPSKESLGLQEEKLTIFFASGVNGGVQHLRFLKTLLPYKDRVQAIVVCGLNERLRRRIEAWRQQTGFTMVLEGYSSRIREYMQLADVMLFKGGANTATRAFYEACPMWFDIVNGVMPQEGLTMNFFLEHGCGNRIFSMRDFADKVKLELDKNGEIEDLKRNILALRGRYLKPTPREFFTEFLRWGFSREHRVVPLPSATM